MTMKELVLETTRQYRGVPHLTRQQVNEILHCALYVIVQELIIQKGFGEIDIRSFGRLYLNRRIHKTQLTPENGVIIWTIRFKVSERLRALINDKMTYEEYISAFHSMTDDAIDVWNLRRSGRKRRGFKRLDVNTDIKEMCMKYHVSQGEIGAYLNEFQSGISANLNRPNLSKEKREKYIKAIKYLAKQKGRLNGEQE